MVVNDREAKNLPAEILLAGDDCLCEICGWRIGVKGVWRSES